MAQRLGKSCLGRSRIAALIQAAHLPRCAARRFGQQIFLSLDLPEDFAGGPAGVNDSFVSKTLLSLEGQLVKILKSELGECQP
jgi:hypothetical protein